MKINSANLEIIQYLMESLSILKKHAVNTDITTKLNQCLFQAILASVYRTLPFFSKKKVPFSLKCCYFKVIFNETPKESALFCANRTLPLISRIAPVNSANFDFFEAWIANISRKFLSAKISFLLFMRQIICYSKFQNF